MKSQIKFGIVDILLCVLLAAVILLNIYAFAIDPRADVKPIEQAERTESASRVVEQTQQVQQDTEQESESSADADGEEAVLLDNSELTPEFLSGSWRMNLFLCEDKSYETYFCQYELEMTLTEVSDGVYTAEIKTVNTEYADGSADGLEEVSGTTTAMLKDGVLTFMLPEIESAVIHMTFMRYDGETFGAAYDSDYLNSIYYASEMFRE